MPRCRWCRRSIPPEADPALFALGAVLGAVVASFAWWLALGMS